MKTHTQTVREGERVSAIDWGYDFRSHFDGLCTNDVGRNEACERSKDRLRKIQDAFSAGQEVRTTTYGGWPRIGMKRVIDVGMYDGWPFWRPTPSVQTMGTLGPEWHSFNSLTDMEIKETTTGADQ